MQFTDRVAAKADASLGIDFTIYAPGEYTTEEEFHANIRAQMDIVREKIAAGWDVLELPTVTQLEGPAYKFTATLTKAKDEPGTTPS